MSIHPKKNKKNEPRWEVVVRYRKDGHRMRKAFVVRGTKAEARAFEAAKLLELESAAKPRDGRDPTFYEFCVEEYKPSAEVSLAPTTWTRRASQLATLIDALGDVRLSKITTAHVDRYKAKRLADRLKRVSVNNELRVLRTVLNFAVEQCRLEFEPPKIVALREGARRPKVWTTEQIQALFEAARMESAMLLPMLVFLANTGCRRGEALALPWSNVDLESGIVMIHPYEARDSDKNERGWQPKNRRPREIPISRGLRPWLDGSREGRWVFPSRMGDRYAFWPEAAYQRVQKAAGLSGGVHTLRHSYASHFLRSNPDLPLLARILGHSHTRVTELYSHLLPGHLEEGRNAVVFSPSVGPAAVTAEQRWSVHRKPNKAKPAKTKKSEAS